MATDRLYLEDSERRTFEATVVDHVDGSVVLDRTAFYPTGGGQPHDTGTLTDGEETWTVTAVNGREPILHDLAADPPEVGASVTGTIDWERRHAHMRYHSAQHLLSAVLLEEFDARTTGNQLYADRARLDCEHERFSQADLATVESRVLELIEADLPITWYTMSRAEAERSLDPERTRLNLLPASVETVRIVEIDGLDRTACAGTHVTSTGPIADFEVTGRETGGRDRERVRFRLPAESGS